MYLYNLIHIKYHKIINKEYVYKLLCRLFLFYNKFVEVGEKIFKKCKTNIDEDLLES